MSRLLCFMHSLRRLNSYQISRGDFKRIQNRVSDTYLGPRQMSDSKASALVQLAHEESLRPRKTRVVLYLPCWRPIVHKTYELPSDLQAL